MFPYTEKHTESESDIQNNNLLYKTDKIFQNTFDNLENIGKYSKTCFKLLFHYFYKLHNSYFFVTFVILEFGISGQVGICPRVHVVGIVGVRDRTKSTIYIYIHINIPAMAATVSFLTLSFNRLV